MNELFKEFETSFLSEANPSPSGLDVRETSEAYVVTGELPGSQPDDVHVSVHKGVLQIRATRSRPAREGFVARKLERPVSKTEWTVALNARVEPEQAKATLSNGLFELTLPKIAEAKPKTITINAK